MLKANITGTPVLANTETTIVEWISDGTSNVIGFTGTGTYSGDFRFYVVEVDSVGTEIISKGYYVYQTSPSNRTAYIVDRAFQVPVNHKVRVTVKHDSVDTQDFYGTILGGSY